LPATDRNGSRAVDRCARGLDWKQSAELRDAAYGVDPDAPGWSGLVLKAAKELLGKA